MSLTHIHECDGCKKTVSQKTLYIGVMLPENWHAFTFARLDLTVCGLDCVMPAIYEALAQLKAADDAVQATRLENRLAATQSEGAH